MTKTNSLVAIITRTKNRTLLLERCVRTVLAQTSPDWVHIIVNDGGELEPVNRIVAKYKSKYAGRLKVIHNEKSGGMEAASNIGIRASDSKYLVILDDDDTWAPSFLRKMVDALQAETWDETRGIFCHTEIVYEKIRGNKVLETGRKDFNGWIDNIELLRLFAVNRFTPVCFLFERSALEEVGMFDETLPVIGDWEFNIRFLTKFEIAVYPEYLAFWHQRLKTKGDLSNSVHGDRNLHDTYRARLANKWLRQSLRRGTSDFGEIFALSIVIEHQHLMENRFHRFSRRIEKNPLYRLYDMIRSLFR